MCFHAILREPIFLTAIKRTTAYSLSDNPVNLDKEPWPWDAIEETWLDEEGKFRNMPDLINGLAYTMRRIKFDIMVSLDDFDVEATAHLRNTSESMAWEGTTAQGISEISWPCV